MAADSIMMQTIQTTVILAAAVTAPLLLCAWMRKGVRKSIQRALHAGLSKHFADDEEEPTRVVLRIYNTRRPSSCAARTFVEAYRTQCANDSVVEILEEVHQLHVNNEKHEKHEKNEQDSTMSLSSLAFVCEIRSPSHTYVLRSIDSVCRYFGKKLYLYPTIPLHAARVDDALACVTKICGVVDADIANDDGGGAMYHGVWSFLSSHSDTTEPHFPTHLSSVTILDLDHHFSNIEQYLLLKDEESKHKEVWLSAMNKPSVADVVLHDVFDFVQTWYGRRILEQRLRKFPNVFAYSSRRDWKKELSELFEDE